MAWTADIDWLDGEIVTEEKLDQLTQNVIFNHASIVPAGCIMMWSTLWSSGTIPDGWKLCNGNNNTPDLRDRFIVGAGTTYASDATGGDDTHTHNLSSHTHNIVDASIQHQHSMQSHTHGMKNHAHYNNFNSGAEGGHYHRTPIGFDGSSVMMWADGSWNPIFGSFVVSGSGKKWSQGNSSGQGLRLAWTEAVANHQHSVIGWTGSPNNNTSDGPSTGNTGNMTANSSHNHSCGTPSNNTSGSGSNIPKYYALVYIMKS